ncbi:MAG: holo-[acyl-carrier protein] synthase [Nocardioidaceae bacterium]|nr:holo-[acyl-carrier protein] synthase [Nocardioidaceae bacterium]
MIVGVGIDVVDIERFSETLSRTPSIRTRLFTELELERSLASLAARFAAKEALAKALGAPADLRWVDVEVRTDTSGRPSMSLSGTVARRAAELGVDVTHVSMSHDAGIASAVVVLEANR